MNSSSRSGPVGRSQETPSPITVLVCGGRDFIDMPAVAKALDALHAYRPIACILEGGATGADRCAWRWAISRGVRTERFQAEWDRLGRAAGPIRNRDMLLFGKPDVVLGFPGGKGTANMLSLAQDAGVQIIQPLGDGDAKQSSTKANSGLNPNPLPDEPG